VSEPALGSASVTAAQLQPELQEDADVVEVLLAGLGLAEHIPVCRVNEMNLGAPRAAR
jgi:hypothetical protein